MAEQYVFDNRRVVFVQRVIPTRMMSGDNREYHRIMRERTVRILLEDGEALEVPHSALTPASDTVSDEVMAKWLEDAKASWAKRRGELNLQDVNHPRPEGRGFWPWSSWLWSEPSRVSVPASSALHPGYLHRQLPRRFDGCVIFQGVAPRWLSEGQPQPTPGDTLVKQEKSNRGGPRPEGRGMLLFAQRDRRGLRQVGERAGRRVSPTPPTQ